MTDQMRPVVDAATLLSDKMLTLGGEDILGLAGGVDMDDGGVVAVGSKAAQTVRRLRAGYPDLLLVQQPDAHTWHAATAEMPLSIDVPADEEGADVLFSVPMRLEDHLDAQITNGASMAVLPVGYIPNVKSVLTAVMKRARDVERTDTVVHLPLDFSWMREDSVRKVIAAVKMSPHPVAISLAHNQDPSSQKGVVEGLRRLFGEAPAAFWYADLGGLDALAHGALAAAIGVSSTYRHIVAPTNTAFSPNPLDRTPNVLSVDLLRYKRAAQMTVEWYASKPAPVCTCPPCDGRSLDSFSRSTEDILRAHQHNLHQLTQLHAQLRAAPNRDLWWDDRLRDADVAHERLSAEINVKVKPVGALKRWIELVEPPA